MTPASHATDIERITWRPVVFTFTFTDKQVKSGSEAILKPYTDRLELLDIKTVHPFLTDATSHVVASKRNLPKALTALVHARHLVTEAFIDKVVEAATSPGFEADGETPIRSPLEWDFEGSWPNALDFVPEPGKEPHPRPPEYFAPAKERSSVFEGFTFIFADASQFENLSAPLTGGAAKCAHLPVEIGKTTAKQFGDQVRNHSGKKTFDPHSPRGVVVVRLSPVKDAATTDWITAFTQDVDAELGQRSVWQNEFLDAILTKEVSQLKRSLEEDFEGVASTEPPRRMTMESQRRSVQSSRRSNDSAKQVAATEDQPSDAETPAKAKKPSWRDRKKATVFKGFDNFSDEEPEDMGPAASEAANEASGSGRGVAGDESQGLFVSQNDDQAMTDPGRPLKREAPSEKDQMDKLLPASRAFKRRRVDQGTEHDAERPEMAPDEEEGSHQTLIVKKGSTGSNRVESSDLRSAAQSHAKARDMKRSGKAALDDEEEEAGDLSEIAAKLVIEEMEIPQRAARPRRQNQTDGARWKPEWNGRKNFKQFRRKGEAVANRGQRVIVRVEEDRGHGHEGSDEDGMGIGSARREDSQGQANAETPEAVEVGDSGSDVSLEDIVNGAMTGRTNQRGTKRAATSQSQRGGAKKAKTTTRPTRRTGIRRNEDSESSSDEDGLKFKLRR